MSLHCLDFPSAQALVEFVNSHGVPPQNVAAIVGWTLFYWE